MRISKILTYTGKYENILRTCDPCPGVGTLDPLIPESPINSYSFNVSKYVFLRECNVRAFVIRMKITFYSYDSV